MKFISLFNYVDLVLDFAGGGFKVLVTLDKKFGNL